MLGLLSILRPRNIILPVALVFAAAMMLYIVNTQRTINTLRSEVISLEVDKAQLVTAVNTQNNTITFLRTQAQLIEQEYRDTEQAFADARRDAQNLQKQLLAGEIDKLSKQSYATSEISINATTAKIYRCFELLSGAPLNEQETIATTNQQFNDICPWLFKP
jgi:hypothetical protein